MTRPCAHAVAAFVVVINTLVQGEDVPTVTPSVNLVSVLHSGHW